MELNREILEAEFLMQLNFAEFTNSKLTSPIRKEYLEYALSLIKELAEEAQTYKKHHDIMDVECSRLEKRNDELTEENERLKSVEFTCGFIKPHKVLECPIFDEVARTKADTVRSMRSRIKSRCIAGGIYPAFVENVIDQIAKEMLEENK